MSTGWGALGAERSREDAAVGGTGGSSGCQVFVGRRGRARARVRALGAERPNVRGRTWTGRVRGALIIERLREDGDGNE